MIAVFIILFNIIIIQVSGIDWIYVNTTDASFRRGSTNGLKYKSVGASLYPHWGGTNDDYNRRHILYGKANGLTSYRAVLIFEQFNGNPNTDLLWSSSVWRPIDALLASARDQNVHVTIELSGLANWMASLSTPLEPYSPDNYYLWDRLVDFVTLRKNTQNGMLYREDATIFAYSILGEVIPYPKEIRSNITTLLRRVAKRIRMNDPNHLIGSGGLLHFSQYSGYHDPSLYWQSIYSSREIDFCMAHIYQQPDKVLPRTSGGSFQASEWSQLSRYSKYCADRGKPYIIDEFGLQMDGYDRATVVSYFSYAFDAIAKTVPPIPIAQIWNWNPGATFDFFANEDMLLLQIVRTNARRFGFDEPFGTVRSLGTDGFQMQGVQVTNRKIIDFETLSDMSSVSSLYSFSRSDEKSSLGTWSLRMDWDFPSTAFAVRTLTFSPASIWSTDWSDYAVSDGRLVCDTYIESMFPTSPTGYQVRFEITGKSGRNYVQSGKAYWTNFLLLFQWNRVYVRLDHAKLSEEFSSASSVDFNTWLGELSQVNSFKISLIHPSFARAQKGTFRVDNCRLEIASMTDTEIVVHENAANTQQCPKVFFVQAQDGIIDLTSSQPLVVKPLTSTSTSTPKITTITSTSASTTLRAFFFDPQKLESSEISDTQYFLFYLGLCLIVISIFMFVVTQAYKKRFIANQKTETSGSTNALTASNDEIGD